MAKSNNPLTPGSRDYEDYMRAMRAFRSLLKTFKDAELAELLSNSSDSTSLARKFENAVLRKTFDGQGMPTTNVDRLRRIIMLAASRIALMAKESQERPTFVTAGGDAFLNWLLIPAFPHFRKMLKSHGDEGDGKIHPNIRLPLMSIRRDGLADLLNDCTVDFAIMRSPTKRIRVNSKVDRPQNDVFAHELDFENLDREIKKAASSWSWHEYLESMFHKRYGREIEGKKKDQDLTDEENKRIATTYASKLGDTISIPLGRYEYVICADKDVYEKAKTDSGGEDVATCLPLAARLNHVAHGKTAQDDFYSLNMEQMIKDLKRPFHVGLECENFAQALTSARFGRCAAIVPSLIYGLPNLNDLHVVTRFKSVPEQSVSLFAKVTWLKEEEDICWIFFYLAKALREVAEQSWNAYQKKLSES